MIKENQKPMIKGLIIAVLSLMLLITLPFITSLISEREVFQEEVTSEVTSKWGKDQTIIGPFILVEYTTNYIAEDGKTMRQRHSYLQAPTNQDFTGDIKTQIKKRSLYEVTLYNTNLNIKASFPTLDELATKLNLIDKESFNSAKLIFSVSDSKGFIQEIFINKDPKQFFEQDRSLIATPAYNFLSYDILDKDINLGEISFPILLKGSTELNFLATAKQTNVNIKSDYKDIKYIGNYLPETDEKEISNENSKWTIYQSIPINSNLETIHQLQDYSFGMKFIQMNDFYSKVNRATKYALLFIGLTFATFFFMENIKNLAINLLHYTLVGLALCINFILLLSFAEYLGFTIAYAISASATILLITSFIYGLSKNKRIAMTIFGLLAALYAFLFFLLQLKEAALIVGSLGLFTILAILMYFSRRIKFSSEKE
ncbi:cell envelope integrity protein CreD [Myroides marinus]|uniref:cell envelope integrity protein CreD n=1 Tax=Myroides marinus TaxID=703342 RepID=UPI002577463D|nr:cell envelope integrity protein CreD [Myroides marinus]MDM1347356.1 cell envelope integrity protein CreD [Myroides marinus]MDM1349676.1 cell envelope integrity protein CreD [Myroides marinus]MDM1354493.1 cell envelope integrity protein CreD [Myroides marinus]MDM1356885.1 cell envelope integrity protein CreD [Myroides marinus]MDM1364459.1 cell envelope integrity protein CreD [Myroides marinus]